MSKLSNINTQVEHEQFFWTAWPYVLNSSTVGLYFYANCIFFESYKTICDLSECATFSSS